jgi:peptide deformylase
MALLKILQYPDPLLRRKAFPVTDIKSAIIQRTIDDMLETLANTADCAALAATQLSIEVPPMITVIDSPVEVGTVLCLVNPEIIIAEGEFSAMEGCMSVAPGRISTTVKRAAKVKAKAFDRRGKPIELNAEGYFAKCIQHEIDHLFGVLYIDKLSALKRLLIEKKLKKLR